MPRRPARADLQAQSGGAYLVFIICFCLMLTAVVVASLIPTSASVLALEALLLLPPLVYVRLRRLPMAEALRWRPVARGIVLRAALLGVLARGMTVPINLIAQPIMEPLFGPAPGLDHLVPKTGTDLASFLVFGAVLAGLSEEILFRGAIQGSLEARGIRKAIVVTAVLFTLLHLMPWYFLEIFAIGVVLGIVTVRTNSIVPAVIVHICNNALEFTGTFIVGRELPAGPPWAVLALAVLFLAVFVEFLRRTREAQWQPSPLAGTARNVQEESETARPAE